jgi:hypothetical protein
MKTYRPVSGSDCVWEECTIAVGPRRFETLTIKRTTKPAYLRICAGAICYSGMKSGRIDGITWSWKIRSGKNVLDLFHKSDRVFCGEVKSRTDVEKHLSVLVFDCRFC